MPEIVQCYKCGHEWEADHTDLGSYFCPECEKSQNKDSKKPLDAAFEYLEKEKKL